MRNTPYALRTYLQTYDNTVSKYVPLDLFPDQVSLIEDYDKYNENIALKYRQAGVSTVTAAWISKKLWHQLYHWKYFGAIRQKD